MGGGRPTVQGSLSIIMVMIVKILSWLVAHGNIKSYFRNRKRTNKKEFIPDNEE